jgi:hypothetical protein
MGKMVGFETCTKVREKARSKTHAVCESVLKSMRNVRKRSTFFNFLLVFFGFFRFFHIFRRGVCRFDRAG